MIELFFRGLPRRYFPENSVMILDDFDDDDDDDFAFVMWEKENLKRKHHYYLKVKSLVGKKDILTEILYFITNSLIDHLKVIGHYLCS